MSQILQERAMTDDLCLLDLFSLAQQAARFCLAPSDGVRRTRNTFGDIRQCSRTVSMGAENGINGAVHDAVHDDRVEALRAEMAKANIDAYIIPTEEPHMVGAQEHMPTEY